MTRVGTVLILITTACEVHGFGLGARDAPTVQGFDERLAADCGEDGASTKCEALDANVSRQAALCEKQQAEATRNADMPDCSVINHQLAAVRQRAQKLHAVLTTKDEEPPPDNSWTNPDGPRSEPQSTPEPDNGPCKAKKQMIVPERDANGMPTGEMIAIFPGTRTWTDKRERVTENCTPNAAEIALLPAKDRTPLTEAQIKAKVAADAARPKSEMQKEMEDDMAYRRAHGQAPGNTQFPAGHYEVTGVH